MRLVFADVSEYCGWIQKKIRDRLDSAIARGSNKLIHGGVVESPRPVVAPAESRRCVNHSEFGQPLRMLCREPQRHVSRRGEPDHRHLP